MAKNILLSTKLRGNKNCWPPKSKCSWKIMSLTSCIKPLCVFRLRSGLPEVWCRLVESVHKTKSSTWNKHLMQGITFRLKTTSLMQILNRVHFWTPLLVAIQVTSTKNCCTGAYKSNYQGNHKLIWFNVWLNIHRFEIHEDSRQDLLSRITIIVCLSWATLWLMDLNLRNLACNFLKNPFWNQKLV